jgi:hypothetical protein
MYALSYQAFISNHENKIFAHRFIAVRTLSPLRRSADRLLQGYAMRTIPFSKYDEIDRLIKSKIISNYLLGIKTI